ncbi:hypothetical protein P691DRAFT_553218 [Macrolepiota fuliginosa MF-IS2]|uniref:Nephrocystin 3-like N-terminal domain-containing protein n=1 Tax=Macrolepiota fuliginosa MF-IS2 TaxID=1400762 RepID=A0A9P5WZU0_9AGAR|nr:hypothetical protein P691DRAFT_553218 [Macrolepiota fuliginosa MF-IS2]
MSPSSLVDEWRGEDAHRRLEVHTLVASQEVSQNSENRGSAKTMTGYSSVKGGRPQNVNQPSRPYPIALHSNSGAEFPNTRNTRHSEAMGPDSTTNRLPAAGKLAPSDQPRTAGGTRLASSGLVSNSQEGAGLVDRCDDVTPHVDRRLADMNQVSGPSQPVVGSSTGASFFSGAENVVINQPTMIDQSRTTHIVHTLRKTVLDILYQEMTKGADVDSSVRWPQPKCYPGTRVRLTTEIQDWFLHNNRNCNFIWLSGPAGVGKSAVAQSVAEFALEEGILGAAYFFSRPNGRDKYMEVFITLAYQLAVRFPGYKSLITAKLVDEPDLLEKTPCVQFRKLIVEPLLLLSHERKRVIILDGLDECGGEGNQLEIIELINSLHSNTSLPIIWMICSRPEPHLKRIFARSDYAIQCWREFLPIDSEESRVDTDTFIRGRFEEIHKTYGEHVEEDANGCWPRETAVKQIVDKTSGLFILADTLLRHIEDSEVGDPDERLREVLAFIRHSHLIGPQNPMHDLDLFYIRILSVIPDDHWSSIRQILVAASFSGHYNEQLSPWHICNLLGITRTKFYAVMRRLHSVIDIPEPYDAYNKPLYFFHATFLDCLTDPNRAGRFFIGKLVTDNRITIAAGLRDFYISGLRSLGSTMGISLAGKCPGEVWHNQEVTRSLREALSWSIGVANSYWICAEDTLWVFRGYFFDITRMLLQHSNLDDHLLGALCSFDFNALALTSSRMPTLPPLQLLSKLQTYSLVRVQSISEWDRALLSKVAAKYPHMAPCDFGDPGEDGFFLGPYFQ